MTIKTHHLPRRLLLLFISVLLLMFSACGGETETSGDATSGAATPRAESSGLSATELKNGVGPIQNVELDATIDEALAAQGETIFSSKCTACHKFDQRYVGPPLGEVLTQRTPAYIMNMMLNPAEMLEKHPEAKAMLAQYLTPMPSQNLSEEDARAVLEYLRTIQIAAEGSAQ